MKPIVTLSVVTIAVAAVPTVGYQLGASSGHSGNPVASTATTAPQETQRKVLYWYDPMTPGQRFNKSGESPFIDMDLVPPYADETQDDGGITISARQQQNFVKNSMS
ncbi:MAG: heavy metal-binding domain-containing protein [Symbiopectobacterium sp.]|uniref:heavy metal-binding domain-containing protein n=1 Tax=Symbiopectobacterium sp. TaxID=2952789 RepID=UPI003F3EFDB9